MTYTPIPVDTLNWDVPLNAALVDQDSRITSNTSSISAVTTTANSAVPKDTLFISVKDHGATGDGVTDDTAAIQAAINLVPGTGGVILFPPGNYLLNSPSSLSVTTAGTILRGSGAENTKILIGSSFTGARAISVTAYNCQVTEMSVSGASSTTTSNPVANGIEITGVRRAKVNRVTFFNINGWAIKAAATSANGNSNPLGTQISQVFGNACAGGIYFLGNTTQGFAMNSQVSDTQFYVGGVTTGASANLDGIRVEDAWDVLLSGVFSWMSVGTGSSLHIKGNTAASFVNNLDALGPSTGPCVLIEDGANGSPQNTQISGGVIQQGLVGVQISGGSKQVHLTTSRIINNQTHGVQVDGTSTTIYLSDLFFSASGNGATGTNYDINWSGTAVGFVSGCRFASPIVAVSSPGIQNVMNINSAGQNVRVLNASFQGTGSTTSNWFTNTPNGVLEESNGKLNFFTGLTAQGNMALQPAASGNTVVSLNVNGADGFDRFRLTGDGAMTIGTGAAARDTQWGRQGIANIGTTNSDISINLAGKGLQVKSGTNAKAGTVTASGTTPVTVSTTAVTANSAIILSYKSGTQAATQSAWVSALTAGTSFQIKSITGDSAVYNWIIFDLI